MVSGTKQVKCKGVFPSLFPMEANILALVLLLLLLLLLLLSLSNRLCGGGGGGGGGGCFSDGIKAHSI